MADLSKTPLHSLHEELGARMVPFAGYEMPVQFPPGVMKEHLHCRAAAGLFDVSHMGQVIVRAADGTARTAALALEALVPADLEGLVDGRQRYGLLTDASGGILDDLMIANRGDHLFLVVNAARKADDISHLHAHLTEGCAVEELTDRALVALQGPEAERVLAAVVPGVPDMAFMVVVTADSAFGDLWISRSGYTGEDGFEISVPAATADSFARALLANEAVEPIGLGARDSLRLEAGLCLYGHDIDRTTTPVEAALGWSIGKARRRGGARESGFPGEERILHELSEGAPRKRVGLLPEGRAPIREGTPLFVGEGDPQSIGAVTSGAYGPSIERPMAMGYVPIDQAAVGTKLWAELRGRRLPVTVAAMPFRPATYKR